MCKKILPFICVFLFCNRSWANIYAIDFSKINYPAQLQDKIDFLKGNVNMYNHWSNQWTYNISKSDIVNNLISLYTSITKLPEKNIETYLLLGDIAHYLYNLDVDSCYQKAVDNYKQAQNINPTDYRSYWFLGNHYALSINQVLSIQNYKLALQFLPANVSPAFWSDYAIACTNAGMLGTAKYAIEQSSKLLGEKSYMEDHIVTMYKNTYHLPPKDTTITAKDLWMDNKEDNDEVLFNNFVLGLGLTVDGSWNVSIGGYQNGTSYITLMPEMAKAADGKKIGYSMLLLVKSPDQGLTLNEYLSKFIPEDKNRQPVSFNIRNIKNYEAYEITDPEMYQNMGGGRMYIIGFERDQPAYPDMALEIPMEIPRTNTSGINYYKMNQRYGRLQGKLYYVIMLDTCEYINDPSLAVFEHFLENDVVIE